MARRKKRDDSEELPLFDLPLRPPAEAETAFAVEQPDVEVLEPQPDAGEPDAGEPDAGEPDAGEPDAGEPDAGEPDVGEVLLDNAARGMVTRRPAGREPVQPTLFPTADLIFDPPERAPARPPTRPPTRERPPTPVRPLTAAPPAAAGAPADLAVAAPLGDRLLGGLFDFGVQLLVLTAAIGAAYQMGAQLTYDDWAPFAVLLLVFSFLYWAVPLAFWGQTPGMSWAGHLARSMDDEPLTFRQTALRWLGALLTAGLAGLPLLLALTGRSLSDRISDSKTVIS